MPIKVKTRKILWSKSGNRCALCKCQLVEKIENQNTDFIVGEECHIVSSKSKGPRGDKFPLNDYDIYDNLILLCANHHKLIDEYPETYTQELLLIIKTNHELWIKQTIDKDIEEYNRSINNLEYLDEISTWSKLDSIIQNSHFNFNDFSSITDKDLAIEIAEFFDDLNDFSDLYSDLEIAQKTKYLLEYENILFKLNKRGVLIFGKELFQEYKFGNIPKSQYKTSIFIAAYTHSDSIVDKKLIIKLPDNFTPHFY